MAVGKDIEHENIIATEDTEHIRDWIEENGGRPALDRGQDAVYPAIKFDERREGLKEISWKEFFKILREKDLMFTYNSGYSSQDQNQNPQQNFEFRPKENQDNEMEEAGVFGNTLETRDRDQ